MDYQDRDSELIEIHGKTFCKMIPSSEILSRVGVLAKQIESQITPGEVPVLIGILNGVFRIMADLITALTIPCEIQFVQIRSYQGMQTTGNIRIVKDIDYPLTNREIIIVEDIVDTGQTLKAFTEHLLAQEPKSILIVSLLKKSNISSELSFPIFAGFEIEDKFVVGYGLDYDGLGRDLNDIYQLA